MALDGGDLTMLTLLDLSAAFDTVDHEILLRRLEISYGLRGPVLGWFKTYLDGRTQYVRCSRTESTPTLVLFGVPQGSVCRVLSLSDRRYSLNPLSQTRID